MANDFDALLRTPSPSIRVKRKRADWLESIDSHNSGGETTFSSDDTIDGAVSTDLSQDHDAVRHDRRTCYTAVEVLQEIINSLDSPDNETVTATHGESSTCLFTATYSNGRISSAASKPTLTPRWRSHHRQFVSNRVRKAADGLQSPPAQDTGSPPLESEVLEAGASSSAFYSSVKTTPSRKALFARTAHSTPEFPSQIGGRRRVLHKDKLHCILSEDTAFESVEKCEPPEANIKKHLLTQKPTESPENGLQVIQEAAVEDCLDSTPSAEPLERWGALTQTPVDTASSSSASGDEAVNKPKKLFSIFYMNGQQHNTPKRSTFLNKSKASQSGSPSRKRLRALDPDQTCLNAGQKLIGQITCKQCGMTYSRDQKGERLHQKFHNRDASILQLGNWKTATVVDTFPGVDNGRCLLVTPSSSRHQWSKATAVLQLIDDELGMCDGVPSDPHCKILLYAVGKTIIGCLVALPVVEANPLIVDKSAETGRRQDLHYCNKVEDKTIAVQWGVSRIWVDAAHRRRGVGTRMLDCLRVSLLTESPSGVPKSAIAFSTLTADGQALARSYMTGQDVLVYI